MIEPDSIFEGEESDSFIFDNEEPDTPKSHNWRSEAETDETLEAAPPVYKHRHAFVYKLNNINTAIRGCITCGQTWGTYVMGEPGNLVWHPVQESEEQE